MAETMNVDLDFKSQFYNLQGIHINERKKNFYKLLKSTSPDIPLDQIDIQPRNYQENIFYVDVLIHCKNVDKLMNILKGGNGVLTSKVLKQTWFFQEAFKNMTEENIVNNFLPTLSYSLRMKVLKKLSLALSEEKMDKIFDLVLERYGLFIAKQFLFSCSPGKIIHVLRTNEITFLPEQLKRMLQKDTNLVKVYFEEYKKNNRNDFDDYDFLRYLTWKHPNLYFEWDLGNLRGNIQLGRFTTRAVLKTNKEDVLKADIKSNLFHKGAIVREVREFDKDYLYKFFPTNDMTQIPHYGFGNTLSSFVFKYPLKRRWEVLSQAFKQAYKEDIVDHLIVFEENLATCFPKETKEKWAEIKYLDSENLRYIKYYNPKKAFNLLKDKINFTSDINQRGKMLNALISVCYQSKDYETYKEVLKYICTRHRNDDTNIRGNMIRHITSNIDYNCLTEEHWKYINEIIDIQRVRGEYLSFENITEYLIFVYKKKLSLDEPVRQFIKDCVKIDLSFRLRPNKDPEAECGILKHIVQILPTMPPENRKKNTYTILFTDIVSFNKDNKEQKHWIDLNKCEPIVELIKEVFRKDHTYNRENYQIVNNLVSYNYLYSKNPLKVINEDLILNTVKSMSKKTDGNNVYFFILEMIQSPKRSNFKNNLLEHFFNENMEMYSYYAKHAIKTLLSREPEVISKYFDVILPHDVKFGCLDYAVIKRYSHLGLDEKLISYFKDLVSVSSKCETKGQLLKALSQVMSTKDFLDLVKDYTPDTKKLDLENEEQKELYQTQCEISKAFTNLNESLILAPVLMHFCQGDYLQSSLAALYKVLYRINEEKATLYINILGTRAVSTRKHAVFLVLELLPIKEAMTVYLTLSNKETNISAKKYLFDAVLKYFLKNPLDSLLQMVLSNLNFVDKNDTEMIQKLINSVNKVHNKYKPHFIEQIWEFLDILEQKEVKVMNYRRTLVDIMSQNNESFFLRLNEKFVENLITKYFLSGVDELLERETMFNFIVKYLLSYLDDKHFQVVFTIIKNYKTLHWEFNNKDKLKHIFSFFSNAYSKFDGNDIRFLTMFKRFWQHLFSHQECFMENVLLELMVLFKENPNVKIFSKVVNNLFHGLIAEYGPYIGDLLIQSIKNFYLDINSDSNKDFNLDYFSLYLLQSNVSVFNCSAAFSIIKDFNDNEENDVYSQVIDILKSVDDPSVKIYINELLKKK